MTMIVHLLVEVHARKLQLLLECVAINRVLLGKMQNISMDDHFREVTEMVCSKKNKKWNMIESLNEEEKNEWMERI